MSNRLTAILDAVVSAITGRGFTIGGTVLPVVLRKAPVRRTKLDPAAMITVAKSDVPERVVARAFGWWHTEYLIDVTVVSPYTGPDQSIDEYAAIRDTLVDDFKGPPLAGAPEVFQLGCAPAAWLRPLGETTEWDWQSVQIAATVAHN
jgi:hypothetical protein